MTTQQILFVLKVAELTFQRGKTKTVQRTVQPHLLSLTS